MPRRPRDNAEIVALVARRRRLERTRRARRGRGRLKSAGALLLVAFAALVGAVVLGAVLTPGVIASECSLASLRPISIGTNSFVTARDNSLLGTIPAKRNRQ